MQTKNYVQFLTHTQKNTCITVLLMYLLTWSELNVKDFCYMYCSTNILTEYD